VVWGLTGKEPLGVSVEQRVLYVSDQPHGALTVCLVVARAPTLKENPETGRVHGKQFFAARLRPVATDRVSKKTAVHLIPQLARTGARQRMSRERP